MTTTAALSLGAFATVTATGAIAVQNVGDTSPWWFVAIVAPLGMFAGGLVWWILRQQAIRDKAVADREARREEREEQRAQNDLTQTSVLQECVVQLRDLNTNHKEQSAAIAALPQRVADILRTRPA